MRSFASYRFFVPCLLGLAFGLFWADAVWWHKDNGVREWVEDIPGLDIALNFVHLPAMALFYATARLNLGPSGEAGWVMLVYCYIAQWTVIGALIGLWLAKRHERKNRVA